MSIPSNNQAELDRRSWRGRQPRILALAGAALIVAAACAVYWPCLRGAFVMDDENLITDNTRVTSADGLYRIWFTTEEYEYYPISYSCFWLEWRLWGNAPTGYHVVNLLLHIVAALLVWAILRHLSIPGAFLAALLFAVHPVNVESVAWIAQQREALAMTFFLLSILWYSRGSQQGTTNHGQRTSLWYWLSLLAFVLAMFSKGSVAILPLVLLGLEWWQHQRVSVRDGLRTAPFFLIAAALTLVNVWFETHGAGYLIRDASFGQRLLGAGAAIWFYLSKALVPINLIFIYPLWHIQLADLLWWLPLLAAAVATAALWRHRDSPQANWVRPLLFAWGYFCVALAPVMGFADVGFMRYSLVADHYQHVAMIGVVALVAAALTVWHHRSKGIARSAAAVFIALTVLVLMLLSFAQSHQYENPMELYQQTLAKNPGSWVAHNNLGALLNKSGRTQEAVPHIEQALRLKPDYASAYYNLGVMLFESGHSRQAIAALQQSVRYDPGFSEGHNNLGIALASVGKLTGAVAEFKQAIRLRPDFSQTYNNLGGALVDLGHAQEAIPYLEQALAIDPDYAEAHHNLANALLATGRKLEAIQHLKRVVQLKPDNANAYAALAKACAALNRPEDAIAAAQQALDLARAHGQTALVGELERNLAVYRAEPTTSRDVNPSPAKAP